MNSVHNAATVVESRAKKAGWISVGYETKFFLFRSAAVSKTSRSNVARENGLGLATAHGITVLAAAGFQHSRAPTRPPPGQCHDAPVPMFAG